jgi:hypothetical protein
VDMLLSLSVTPPFQEGPLSENTVAVHRARCDGYIEDLSRHRYLVGCKT